MRVFYINHFFIPLQILTIIMAILRYLLKRKMALLGTACTGVLTGFIIYNGVLPTTTRCLAFCSTQSPAYKYLQRKEAMLKFNHPHISSVYINHLPSNNPTEDRHVIGGWSQECTGLFSVIDGHKSNHCSEHLKNVLLDHVTSVFKEKELLNSKAVDIYNETKHTPETLINLKSTGCSLGQKGNEWIENSLKLSFTSLDHMISEDALKCVRMINKGHSIKENGMLSTIMKALAGACALLSIVTEQSIHVASTGDCRAVLGVKREGVWLPEPLSVDQNAQNNDEIARLKRTHPGEEDTVIIMNRLLGGLMPFRSFGDVDYKWKEKDIEVVTPVPANYKSPPYLIVEPMVTSRKMDGTEGFLVLATDGLWEKLSNEHVIQTAVDTIYGNKTTGLSSLFGHKTEDCCNHDNIATRLLWEALGGNEASVDKMINLPQALSRMYRDDITIIVIKFKND